MDVFLEVQTQLLGLLSMARLLPLAFTGASIPCEEGSRNLHHSHFRGENFASYGEMLHFRGREFFRFKGKKFL